MLNLDDNIRRDIDHMANQLCLAVDGKFDFKVESNSNDIVLQKLSMLINFLLDSADRAIATLDDQQKQTKAMFENTVEGIVLFNKYFTIITINRSAMNILQKADNSQDTFTKYLNADTAREFKEKIAKSSGQIQLDGLTMLSDVPIRIGAAQFVLNQQEFVVCTLQDLSAEKESEKKLNNAKQQLLQSEKLAAIGQLAAGVAHEINTPVGFINSNISTLEEYATDLIAIINEYNNLDKLVGNEFNGKLETIKKIKADKNIDYIANDIVNLISESKEGVGRVKRIVQGLRNFARVSSDKFAEANVNDCITNTLNVAKNEIKYKAEISLDLQEIGDIECLSDQLNQVFLNLIINAAQSIKENGKINIKTRRQTNTVTIEVQDTGCGIDPGHISRIFEPFFTTKEIGQGTGLGLALSYGIIEKHHGKITVHSELSVGTTFLITLPIKQSGTEERIKHECR